VKTNVLLAVVLVAAAGAVGTEVIVNSTMDDFIDGERENLSLLAPGGLSLMPEAQTLLEDAGMAALCAASRGKSLYVGGISPAGVWRVEGGKSVLLWKADDGAVTALCAWGKDVVAAVGPAGSLFVLPEKEGGQARKLASLPVSYVFAMAVSGKGEELLCATGDPAALYAVGRDGGVRLVAELKQGSALSLVLTSQGPAVSTEPDGLVVLVREGEAPTVLFDAPEEEVRALALDADGGLIAATCQTGMPSLIGAGARPAGEPAAPPEGAVEEDYGDGGDEEELDAALPPGAAPVVPPAPPATAPPAPREPAGANSVYRIALDGRVEQLYSGPEAFYCASVAADGELLLGGASRGQVYRLEKDGRLSSVASLPVEQVVALLAQPDGGLIALSGNPGRAYRPRRAVSRPRGAASPGAGRRPRARASPRRRGPATQAAPGRGGRSGRA